MRFELNPYSRSVSDEDLISDVKKVATDLKKNSVTIDEYNEKGQFHATTLTRRFGNWFKVIELAGLLDSRSTLNISQEELFQNLEEVWIKLGRQPKYVEMQRPLSKYSSGTYENRFGTWRKGLEAFVTYINGEDSRSFQVGLGSMKPDPVTRHRTQRNINWRLRFLVLRRDNFKCKTCGRSPASDPGVILHVDHMTAWVDGGETVFENLQTLCSKCNIGKSDL